MSVNNEIIKVAGSTLYFAGKAYKCAIGKGGFSVDKKEGDGCTPVGIFPLRELWYRADKMPAPKTNLPLRVISENDGWCDDVNSEDYNKYVKLCHPALVAGSGDINKDGAFGLRPRNKCGVTGNNEIGFSHEKLWRSDDVYDLIIPLGYNDSPIVKGKGSAIFLHIARPDYSGTEGCVALSKSDLLEILPLLSGQSCIEISPA